MTGWDKFKASESTETVVIAGEVFEIRKSLKAKEVDDIITKYRSKPEKAFRELIKLVVIDPKPPEDDEELDKIIDEMDAAIKAKLERIVMEKSGLSEYFRLSTT